MPRPTKLLIELLTELGDKDPERYEPEDRALFAELREATNYGLIRGAEKGADGQWKVNVWYRKALLAGVRLGQILEMESFSRTPFFDKHTLPARQLFQTSKVRVVPGGTSVRDGCFVGEGAVIMPPSFVDVGTWIGEGTQLGSHVVVGACAQIGTGVQISAGVQLGGVLEPVEAMPVIIEDDVVIGGSCAIFDGTVVRARAVFGPRVTLDRSTRVYDLVKNEVYGCGDYGCLEIPEGAVVVAGSRPASGDFAAQHKLQVATPLIVKYRDGTTDAASVLEEALR